MKKESRYVWINGEVKSIDSPVLDVNDRGFMIGDGIFETLSVKGGRILEFTQHLNRLKQSAARVAISLPQGLNLLLRRAIDATLNLSDFNGPEDKIAVKITVSRGIDHYFSVAPSKKRDSTIVIQAWTVEQPSKERLEEGLHLITSSVRRDPMNPMSGVKSTSRIDYVYAMIEARTKGGDDALFLTTNGFLCETTSASIFLLKGKELWTPSIDCGILVGTTRNWIISKSARHHGLKVVEGKRTLDNLNVDEAFLASSVKGILPVTRIDDMIIGNGKAGKLTMKLREERENVI